MGVPLVEEHMERKAREESAEIVTRRFRIERGPMARSSASLSKTETPGAAVTGSWCGPANKRAFHGWTSAG